MRRNRVKNKKMNNIKLELIFLNITYSLMYRN